MHRKQVPMGGLNILEELRLIKEVKNSVSVKASVEGGVNIICC